MESPVVVDKPPEYHGNATNERGFPFDEEEATGAWSELAARHPDIAARLRQRPATWARKRRPSSQDGIEDTADSFGGFDRFPFDDIPPEFREHFPTHWNRRFGPREEQYQQQPSSPQPHSPQQQTTATQTEEDPGPTQGEQVPLPQYGLRNTVDLGQKSPADPSVVDADERAHRSMSAPPDHRTLNQNNNNMSGQNHQEPQSHQHQPEQSANVRHIPIFVEGRDEPVINKSVDHGTHFAETEPTYVPPPKPHIDRERYFADDGPVGFPFAKSFDRPFFRQGPQPFTKQKMYPQQAAFPRGGSPQRSQSPKPQNYQEHPPRAETPSRPQQNQAPPQQKQPSPQQRQPSPQQPHPPQQQAPQQQAPPQAASPPPQPQAPSPNDPITQILSIQTDVLNLMTAVENFKGTKKDKKYLYLDEMLTRNLIKLDNIETDGKENIRQARKEAIKCIQKCIAVLEAKADNKSVSTPQPQDVDMQNAEAEKDAVSEENIQNGDVEMKETTKEEQKLETNIVQKQPSTASVPQVQTEEQTQEQKPEETKTEKAPADNKNVDTVQPPNEEQPETKAEVTSEPVPEPQKAENTEKKSPKKVVKKRDKSKDKKEASKENKKEEIVTEKEDNRKDSEDKNVEEEKKDVNKDENKADEKTSVDNKVEKEEVMQVDANSKGDSNKTDSQTMDVDGAASQ